MIELENMRLAMQGMEEERDKLVAEVESQIERALQSMSMSIEMSDSEEDNSNVDGDSSAASSRSASKVGSRRSSNATRSPMRTQSIDSATLAGTTESDEIIKHSLETTTIAEEEEEQPPTTTMNIDATEPAVDRSQDAMVAVDEGIHSTTDRIAQSVLQIQQKVRLS